MYELVPNYQTSKFDLVDDKGTTVSDVANLLEPIQIIGGIEESNYNLVVLRTHENINGHARTREFEIEMVHIVKQADFHTELFKNLYIINYKLINHLRQFLILKMQVLQKQNAITYKHRSLGFYEDIDGETLFLLDENQTVQGLSRYFKDDLNFQMGSFDDYDAFVKQEILPYKHMQLALVLGLSSVAASYLKDYSDTGTIVLNLCGASSTGKSTTAQFIASLWADPHIDKNSLVRTFNFTQGAMFSSLEGFNGVPIILDDATTASYLNKTTLIYQLSQGEARGRLENYGRSIKQGESWSGLALITSETPVLSQSETRQGLIARVIETTDIVWTEDADHSKRIKNFIHSNYGHLGRAYVRFFMAISDDELVKMYEEARTEINDAILIKDNLSDRIINKLAIVMMTAYLVKKCFDYALDFDAIRSMLVEFDQTDVKERHIGIRALETVKNYIQKHHTNFDKYDESGVVLQSSKNILMGIMKYHLNTVDVSIPTESVKDVLRSSRIYEFRTVLKYWGDQNIIHRQSSRNSINVKQLNSRAVQFVFERTDDTILPWLYQSGIHLDGRQMPPSIEDHFDDSEAINDIFDESEKDDGYAN